MTQLIINNDSSLILSSWPIPNKPGEYVKSPFFPLDAEKKIIIYLGPEGLVNFSGAHKAASVFLSNAFFRELFAEMNPYVAGKDEKKRYKQLEGKFACYIHLFPTNFWKVACCYYAKGSFKFHKDVLEAATSKQQEKAKKVVTMICGNSAGDPSSPLNRAEEENTKTIAQHAHNNFEDRYKAIVQGRETEYQSLLEDVLELTVY